MVFLGSAVACPPCDVRLVSSPERDLLETLPQSLEHFLGISELRRTASAGILDDRFEGTPIWWQCLTDDGVEGEIDRRLVIHMQHEPLNVAPQSLDHHSCPLPRDTRRIGGAGPELPAGPAVP